MGGVESTPLSQQEEIKEAFKNPKRDIVKLRRELVRELNSIDKREIEAKNKLKFYCNHKKAPSMIKDQAKQIIVIQRQKNKCQRTMTILEQSELSLKNLQYNTQTTEIFGQIAAVLEKMNKMYPLKAINQTMMAYQKQSAINDMKEETIEEMMEDAFDAEDENDEDENELIEKIFQEIGIEISAELSKINIPTNDINKEKEEELKKLQQQEDESLEERLKKLKNI